MIKNDRIFCYNLILKLNYKSARMDDEKKEDAHVCVPLGYFLGVYCCPIAAKNVLSVSYFPTPIPYQILKKLETVNGIWRSADILKKYRNKFGTIVVQELTNYYDTLCHEVKLILEESIQFPSELAAIIAEYSFVSIFYNSEKYIEIIKKSQEQIIDEISEKASK